MRRSFYILLFTLSCQISLACGPFDRLYSPEQYHTFRICGNNMNGLNNPQNDLQPQAQIAIEKNCQYWSEITSTDIPITDIKEVVYDWNYEQLSRLHACACDSGHLQGNNAFAKWLVKHNDTEVTSYLLLAKRCEIQLSYAIGVAQPTSISVETFGTGKVSAGKLVEIIRENFDLRPAGIIKMLDLRRPIYRQTAAYGHFGRHDLNLPWEKLDKVDALKKYL